MMKQLVRTLTAAGLALLPALALAQPSAHYVPGVEGLKGASLPPPGLYVRDYNVAYYASTRNNASGSAIPFDRFEVFTYANVPRVLWITETKVLGGYLGFDALIPIAYQSAKVGKGGFDADTFGLGDLFAEATLSWHLKQFDFSFGAGTWMPTGDTWSPPTTAIGLGYWTPMLTAGATWFIDSAKTWSVSALSRYEFNTAQEDTDITPGQAYTLEWGIGKSLSKTLDVGVVGYYQQQVNTDGGINASKDRDRVAAVGPEVSLAFPKPMLMASFRYLYEFMSEDRAQGHTFALTLTKRF